MTSFVLALRRRWLALAAGVLTIVGAMAWSFFEMPVVRGLSIWTVGNPSDLWLSWRASGVLLAGGGYSQVFSFDSSLQTAPGWQVLVSPIADHTYQLPFPFPFPNPHPEAWWLVGPLFMLPIVLAFCAADRWMDRIGVIGIGRRLVAFGAMAFLLPPAVFWGHPEDIVCLGFALYALSAARDGRSKAAGWWLGAALGMQFLGLVFLPLCLVGFTARQWRAFLLRAFSIPLALLIVPLVGDPRTTLHALLRQHPSDQHGYITPAWNITPDALYGVWRLAPLLAAVGFAWWCARHRATSDAAILWGLAAILALRTLEPAFNPYYAVPAMVLFVLASTTLSMWRCVLTAVMGLWMTSWMNSPVRASWVHWGELLAQIAVMALIALPPFVSRPPAEERVEATAPGSGEDLAFPDPA